MFLGFPCGSASKESACNVGDLGLIPGLGRSPGEGKGYPVEYSGLENSIGLHSPWGHKESDTAERPKKKKKKTAEIKIRSTHLSKERKPCIPFHISLYSFNLSELI